MEKTCSMSFSKGQLRKQRGRLTCAIEAPVSRTLLLVVSGAPAAPFVSCSALLMVAMTLVGYL